MLHINLQQEMKEVIVSMFVRLAFPAFLAFWKTAAHFSAVDFAALFVVFSPDLHKTLYRICPY